MNESFLETIHSAKSDQPYFDGEMYNINYLAHYHTEVEIVYVKSGTVTICCNENAPCSAYEGDICVFMPGEIHSFSTPCRNHLYIIKINCRNSVSEEDFSMLRISPNILRRGEEMNFALASEIEELKKEMTEKKCGYAYSANAIANKMLAMLLRSPLKRSEEKAKIKQTIASMYVLNRTSGYIDKHYSGDISLADVAAFCNYSVYYYAHFFKKITGTTFFEYLTLYRLNISVKMLINEKRSISEISSLCGFSNVRAYNRAFKKTFGKSPSAYKKEKVK